MYEVEQAMQDLWEKLGPDPTRGLRILGSGWGGVLWDCGDGTCRGILTHATRGLFRATKTGDGPVVIEGWADATPTEP